MRELIISLSILLTGFSLNAQSTSLSTFEEIYIVSSKFENTNVTPSVSLAPESMTYEQMGKVTSLNDFSKIIADTPFLVIKLEKRTVSAKSGIRDSSDSPAIRLGDRLNSSKSLNGEAEWVAIVDNGDNLWMLIPSLKADLLSNFIKNEKLVVVDQEGKYSNVLLTDVSIENEKFLDKK